MCKPKRCGSTELITHQAQSVGVAVEVNGRYGRGIVGIKKEVQTTLEPHAKGRFDLGSVIEEHAIARKRQQRCDLLPLCFQLDPSGSAWEFASQVTVGATT